MRLSIYLARQDVKELDDLIQEEYRRGATPMRPAKTLKFECSTYIRQSRPSPPKWSVFLQGHFDLDSLHLQQRSSSFVLALRAKGRIFAVTFGYGFTAINRSKIEMGFGFKTSLGLLDEAKIRTLDSRNIDRLVRQKRTHVSSGSRIWDFDVSPSAEWVRYVSGKTASDKLGTSVAGSDSLTISCDIGLSDLGEFCAALLKVYESDECRKRFDFLDRMQPLPKSTPIIAELEAELLDRITKRSDKKLVIAYPDFAHEQLVDHYRIGIGHRSVDMHDVSLSGVYKFLDDNPDISPDVDRIWVVGEASDGGRLTEKRTLREYLVCEVAQEDAIYYLSFGEWHRAAKRFVNRVRKQVRELQDDTNRLRLPPMNKGEREDSYNQRVAESKNWLLLDKKTLHIDGHDRVEVCDLYSQAGEFIAVKKMRDSANMSHLFSQASVSATLLTSDEAYRQKVQALVRAKWNRKVPMFSNSLFVLAIPTSKMGDLATEMFLFSQVNLLEHVRAIRSAGHRVSLCKINYAADPN